MRRELGVFAALAAIPAAAPVGTTSTAAHTVTPARTAAPADQCVTRELSPDEMSRGVLSDVECFSTTAQMLRVAGISDRADGDAADSPKALSDVVAFAWHHVNANGGDPTLLVTGGQCDGGGISFAPGDPWNDVISSTTHGACGRIKHFSGAGATGDYQITTGGPGTVVNMDGVLNDRVSSIYYYAS